MRETEGEKEKNAGTMRQEERRKMRENVEKKRRKIIRGKSAKNKNRIRGGRMGKKEEVTKRNNRWIRGRESEIREKDRQKMRGGEEGVTNQKHSHLFSFSIFPLGRGLILYSVSGAKCTLENYFLASETIGGGGDMTKQRNKNICKKKGVT